MIKFVALFACIAVALAAPGLIAEHHHLVQEPVLAKVGSVVHSAPSAVSHQSFTRVHNKAVITPVVQPIVKTTVHAAPVVAVVKTVEPVVPVVKTVAPIVPVVKTVAAAPVVHTYHAAPVVQTYHAAPVVPVVKIVAPDVHVVGHAVSHQSHVQIHSNAAVVAPALVHAAPVVHTIPVVHAAPFAHFVHH